MEKLSPPMKKCLGHIVCITIVFVHAIQASLRKFIAPLVSQAGYGSVGGCCLVTSVSFANQLSLFTIKFFSLTSTFNR